MEPTNIILPTPSHAPDHSSNSPLQSHTEPSRSLQEPIPDQNLSALHAKQPLNDHRDGKGTLQNISSLTDATAPTLADSALNIPSQNISQPGTLNTIDNGSNYDQNKEKMGEGATKSTNEVPSIKLEEDTENLAKSIISQDNEQVQIQYQNGLTNGNDDLKRESSKENHSNDNTNETLATSVTERNQISAEANQDRLETEKSRQEKIESPAKKGLERETSLERLANLDKQNEGEQGAKTPGQLKFETDHSESVSLGTPGNRDYDSTPIAYKMGASSDQQFTSDQQDSEGYYSTGNRNRAGSKNESGLSSTEENKVKEEVKKEAPAKPKISLADFHKIAVLGRGSYGEVSLVKKVSNNKMFALKAIDKYFMKKERKEHQVYVEKEVLMKSNHPNIIKFYSSFQDKKKLYFVLEYVGGGEFSDYLRAQRKLRKEEIIFFTAEVINILEYLHSNQIAHRDIKPENLLLTTDGHLKCIDFGTALFLSPKEAYKNDLHPNQPLPTAPEGEVSAKKDSIEPTSHRKTFVGTAQYVSPEMLEHSECDASADFWALGCMIYVMAVGRYPFEESNEFLIFQKIQNLEINFPNDMDPDVKDLIQKLLRKNPHERLGAGEKGTDNDYAALKNHPLFKGIDFTTLHKCKAPMADIVSPHRQKDQYTSFPSPVEDPIKKLIPTRKHFLSEDLQTLEERMGKIPAQPRASEPKERIILSGLVLKKNGWLFFKPTQLVLNSRPRLVYYDPETNQIKGEIPLERGTVATLESKTKWFITTAAKKKYSFKEMEHSAEKWVETVNAVIAQLNSNKASQA